LQDEFRLELEKGEVNAAHVLTRMMRLQQVTSGYVPLDEGAVVCDGCEGEGCEKCNELGFVGRERFIYQTEQNPRLDALVDEATNAPGKIIVWARFNKDVDLAMDALATAGRKPVRYDGQVSEKQRSANKIAYQTGKADAFVGKARAGGRGIELAHGTSTVLYYSNEFSLELRRQSEDRAHGPNTKNAIGIVDLIAEDTVDERIVQILRSRRNIADLIHGDPKGDWI